MQDSLLKISEQCCDADYYIQLGYVCAKQEICYNFLRPIGAVYWFSLPFRFDVSLDLLFWLQVLILLVVSVTSWFVLNNISESHFRVSSRKYSLFAWLVLNLVVIALLWPTFFNTLSDTPATLFFLEGVLLLLLAGNNNKAICYILGGIMLGLAVIFRTAYFNPLQLALLCFLFFKLSVFLWNKYKGNKVSFQWNSVLVLVCLVPIAAQYWSNWKNMNELVFISREYSETAITVHLATDSAGYDTVFPQNGYHWSPACENARGISSDWGTGNFQGIACLLLSRVYFYLGSYAVHTYLGDYDRDFMDHRLAEDMSFGSSWSGKNVSFEQNAVISPLGDITAPRLTPAINAQAGNDYYVQGTSNMPLPEGDYTWSIWFWSDEPRSLSVKVFTQQLLEGGGRQEDLLFEKELSLPSKPEKFVFDLKKSTVSYLDVRFGNFLDDVTNAKDVHFYAWGARLEPSEGAAGYKRAAALDGKYVGDSNNALHRNFYNLLFLLNILVVSFSFIGLLFYWKKSSQEVLVLLGVLLAGYFGQSIFVVPEQRFVQAALMVSWLFCLLFLPVLLGGKCFQVSLGRCRGLLFPGVEGGQSNNLDKIQVGKDHA
ncbi:MAG TPA: hypothetical protein VLB90_00170 [Pseudomonadales bacterium]|nr:hypothetical protein [Pseudomonadales bacterium]